MVRALFLGELPQLVLFDLDGTLVDSVPDLASAVDHMLLQLDRPPAGIEKVRTWVGNGAAMLVRRALSDSLEPVEIDGDYFESAFELFLTHYGRATSDLSELYPGVLDCLEGLKEQGVILGLVTNKPIAFTNTILEGFKLRPYFKVIYGGDSLPAKKPDPLQLNEAMKYCSVLPDQTLMVGDSVSDVRAARAAGCAVACVPYGYNHGENIAKSDPDLIVESLDQLLL